MERNREARRGSMAVMNGGLSRRRQRSSSLRDSPEEDGAMDMQETGRLRERGSKKDRDRERLSRNKRRRGDRMMHGSNREEGADTSDGSLEEDDDDEEEQAPMPVRLPPAASSIPASSSLPPSNHLRKSFPAKVARAPTAWKADEMIGVPIPRKARSGTAKRSHDCWASGGGSGGGGSGEASHRQPPPNSPARQSHASTGPMSPSSSNASVRKKIKTISGSKPQRPAKMAKSSSIQEIEIEVAEVLFGMTRQLQPKPEGHKPDSKETNGSGNDAKSRVSSPISNSQATGSSQPQASIMPNSNTNPAAVVVTAPKRKRPRPVKFEDESPTSPVSSTAITSAPVASGTKTDSEVLVKTESSSPRTEKTMPSPINDNGGSLLDLGVPQVTSMSASTDRLQEPPKADGESVPDSVVRERIATIDENVVHVKQPAFTDLDVSLDDDRGKKDDMGAEKQREEKFSIDLMAPPPGKLSPERDAFPDPAAEPKPVDSEIKLKIELSGRLEEKREAKPESSEMLHTVRKERILDLQIDLDKHGKEMAGSSKQQGQKLQLKPSGRIDAKSDGKSLGNAGGSVPVPLPVGSWPSNVPPFGYMGHVPSLPAVLPIDGSSGSTKTIQAPNFLSVQPRPSRCMTHYYIAQNIFYHQQMAKLNSFWPAAAAAGTMPLYGAKPYNLNAIPPSESTSIPANSLQGSFPVRNSGPLLDKGAHPSREKSSSTANPQTETAQRKQHPMQQLTPPASHGPAFIFSLNQQAAGAAASVIRSAGPKSTPGAASAVAPSTAANFGVATTGSGGPPATVNFNYAMPVNEAHYLAILQNNAYPFQIPGAVGTPPAYRSGAPVQALPFFNGSFYSSQMLHPSQLQQQQQQPPQQASHTQHGHQNQSTSSGSSSSQKHHSQQPQQRVPGGAAGGLPVPTAGLSSQSIPGSKSKQHLLSHQPQAEPGCEDSPSTADSRVSQAGQKTVPGQNFPMPIHPPNFALISPAAAALGGSATHTEKQSVSQQSGLKVELTPSQAFAMSFTSLGGNAVTAGAPHGLDFSSLAQNHPIFQSLPEAARQGYQITAAASASAQAVQHLKKSQQILEDRSGGESTSTTVGGEEERKVLAACKGTMNVQHQSLNFSRPDNNPSMPSILGNSVMENTPRTLTLIPANVNGGGISHRSSNSVLSSPPSTATVNAQHSQQHQHQQHQHQHQQQQLIQLQKQQQQIIQLQKHQQHQHQHQHQLQHQLASRSKSLASSNSTSIYSERMPAGSTVTKFPPALSGFPQALIQGSSPSQSSQWKSSTKSATSAAASSHPVQSTVKTGIPQQQARISQQSVPPQVHQTQISFGMNSAKMAAPAGQQVTGGNSMPSLSSAPTNIVIGSPQNSAASKTSASGSPRASTNSKSGPPLPATSLPLQQQASAKISPSSSSRKSSPVSNRNVPSILGQPHISSSQSSTINKQQQHQTHQKQPYPQAQLFFSNPYMPVQSSQSNASNAAAAAAVAASYYQRRPTEQQPSQGPNLVAGSTGMLSLCPTTLSLVGAPVTVDPAKAVVAASSMKGMQQAGLLQHPGTASFPYIHGMPSVSIKPAEQKPAAGNDNLNASWQAERR